MSIIDIINTNIGVFGGYTVVVLGLSTWLGHIAAKRIISNHTHAKDKEIEILKQNLEVISHDKKNRITRYDNKKATALENLHLGLVEFEISIRDVLELIRHDWKDFYTKSKEAVENKNEEINKVPILKLSKQEYEENLDKYVPRSKFMEQAEKLKVTLSHNIFLKNVYKHVRNNTDSKWIPELKKINAIILRNEIYLNEDIIRNSRILVYKTEDILQKSVITILTIAQEATDSEKQITEETDKKIRDSFNHILKDCSELFDNLRKQITKEISIILEPK